MKAEAFEPAVVVETSPNNFQAWLNHVQVLEASASTRAAKQLAERFGGDPSSADWRHFGRLAGFTNPKPERLLPSGMRPFARLRSAKGRICSKASEFVAGIRSSNDGQEGRGEEPAITGGAGAQGTRESDRLKSSTLRWPMAVIFTVPTWPERNTLPAVV